MKIVHQGREYAQDETIKINTDDYDNSLNAPFSCFTKGAEPKPTIGFLKPKDNFATVLQIVLAK